MSNRRAYLSSGRLNAAFRMTETTPQWHDSDGGSNATATRHGRACPNRVNCQN